MILRNSTANAITDASIAAIIFDMLPNSFGAAADTAVTNSTNGGTEIQATKTGGGSTVAWISPRVATGFTLTSTDISVWAQESNMANNIGSRYRIFRRTSGGTVTEIGGGPFNDDLEMNNAAREDLWVGNVTDTVINVDDRLILKLYLTNFGSMVAATNGATFTFNAASGTTGDSFLNLAETVSFKGEPARIYVSAFSFEVPAAEGEPPTGGITGVHLLGQRARLVGVGGLVG